MIKKKIFIVAICATLIMGGISPLKVIKAENRVIMLKTPTQASEALNEDVGNSKDPKKAIKEKKEDVESRIIVKTTSTIEDVPQDCDIYYYSVGGYYILECANKSQADRMEHSLALRYGEENVIRDRIIKEEATESGVYSYGDSDNGENNEETIPFDGIHAMGMDTLKENAKKWSGSVTVAVIDSGVDRNHEMLKDRIDEIKSINLSGMEPENQYDDTYGHGTHVSGIIADATPNQVKIMAVRVFDDYQMSSLTQITLGIDYARENGADVMNMSLGHTSPTAKECELINEAMEKSVSKGITLLAASGNENNNVSTSTPANSSWTISVGAIEQGKTEGEYIRSWYSNYGERLDFVAPGTNIESGWADGTKVIASGTSMATPHLAAAAAMIKLKHPDYNQWDIYATFLDYTVDLGEIGKDVYYGYGYVNLKDYASENGADTNNKKYQAIGAKTVLKTTMNSLGTTYSLNVKLQRGDGALTYKSSNTGVADVNNGKVVIKGVGKCNIEVTASETDLYKETKRVVQVEVTKGNQEIEIPVTKYEKNIGDKGFYLKASVKKPGDGIITYVTNNNDIIDVTNDGFVTIKKAGTAYVYPMASSTKNFKEQIGNAIEISISDKRIQQSETTQDKSVANIISSEKTDAKTKLSKTKIKSVKRKSNKIKVRLTRVKKVTGYEIKYFCGKKSKKKKAKIIRSRNNIITISKLKKSKVYSIQVRVYYIDGKETEYSSWSAIKRVKLR